MMKYFFSFAVALLALVSCNEVDEGISYTRTSFPVGEVKWRSDVSDADRAVIAGLIDNMIKVEACQTFMGQQARSTSRANFYSLLQQHDTIWHRKGEPRAYWRDLKTADTLWYDAGMDYFSNTYSTKYDTVNYSLIYRSGALWVGPVVELSMPDYYIGKFEVTQAQWMAVMHRAPKGSYCVLPDKSGTAAWYEEFGLGDNIAAYNIWYEDAVAFCEELSSKTGLSFRLPTEAEWECAARGGKYCRGYKYAGADEYTKVAWTHSNACAQKIGSPDYGIHAGGELQANELGLCDMSGNVAEWVGNAYYRYSRRDTINPQGIAPTMTASDTLILRGGSWMQKKYSDFCIGNRKQCIMSSYTDEESKQSAFMNCGFRVAL